MAKQSPLQALKSLHGSKDKLIESIHDAVKSEGESKSDTVARLRSVSNKKLLRMSEVAKTIADRGGRDKVVEAIGSALGRAKDADYLSKLRTFSNGRLVDMLGAAEKKSKRSA
jgi:hypothetical protein